MWYNGKKRKVKKNPNTLIPDWNVMFKFGHRKNLKKYKRVPNGNCITIYTFNIQHSNWILHFQCE